jgi:Holliday junction resolvasome RuvABC ATP-dependent DNA helicase subunit
MNDMNDMFPEIIGQPSAKKALEFFLDGYLKTRIMPFLMFVAPKGQGKTTFAKAVGKKLVQFDEDGRTIQVPDAGNPDAYHAKRKPYIELNCSSIRNLPQFINSVVVPYIQDKDVTVLFDEASELPRDVSMALLTILEPSADNRRTFVHGDYTCEFDFRRQTIMFATSEIHKVFHALVDRMEKVVLEDYSADDLAAIVAKNLSGTKASPDVLKEVASVLRGNGRAAAKMAGKMLALGTGEEFTMDNWLRLKHFLSILPLGLNQAELQVLRTLAANPSGTSLTAMSSKTGFTREALQKEVELYLLRLGLMKIETAGRMPTKLGLEYLRALDASKAAVNTLPAKDGVVPV